MQETFERLLELLQDTKNVVITGHVDPDGDCLGSMFALKEWIADCFGIHAGVLIDGEIPYNYGKYFIKEKTMIPEAISLLFILDCANSSRMGKFECLRNKAAVVILIDHHKTSSLLCDLSIVDSQASSTGELLFDFFCYAGNMISQRIYIYLYICVLTDTGKFTNASTTARAHEIAARAISRGVDVKKIADDVYFSKPPRIQKAYAESLNTLDIYAEGKIACVCVRQEIVKKNGVNMEELDGFVDFLTEIEGLRIACVLKEYGPERTKVSLRGVDTDVSELAARYGGGGHRHAAGCTLSLGLEKTKEIILNDIFESCCQ